MEDYIDFGNDKSLDIAKDITIKAGIRAVELATVVHYGIAAKRGDCSANAPYQLYISHAAVVGCDRVKSGSSLIWR